MNLNQSSQEIAVESFQVTLYQIIHLRVDGMCNASDLTSP